MFDVAINITIPARMLVRIKPDFMFYIYSSSVAIKHQSTPAVYLALLTPVGAFKLNVSISFSQI